MVSLQIYLCKMAEASPITQGENSQLGGHLVRHRPAERYSKNKKRNYAADNAKFGKPGLLRHVVEAARQRVGR